MLLYISCIDNSFLYTSRYSRVLCLHNWHRLNIQDRIIVHFHVKIAVKVDFKSPRKLFRSRIIKHEYGTVPYYLRINIQQKQSNGEHCVLRYSKCFENPALKTGSANLHLISKWFAQPVRTLCIASLNILSELCAPITEHTQRTSANTVPPSLNIPSEPVRTLCSHHWTYPANRCELCALITEHTQRTPSLNTPSEPVRTLCPHRWT